MLLGTGRTDPRLIGILMTESFFRGPLRRLFEYFAFYTLRIVRHRRAGRISLGLAQLQARHWKSRPTIDSVLSPIRAYDMLDDYLAGRGCRYASTRNIVAAQVGEIRGHYFELVESFTQIANTWIATPQLGHGHRDGAASAFEPPG